MTKLLLSDIISLYINCHANYCDFNLNCHHYLHPYRVWCCSGCFCDAFLFLLLFNFGPINK